MITVFNLNMAKLLNNILNNINNLNIKYDYKKLLIARLFVYIVVLYEQYGVIEVSI